MLQQRVRLAARGQQQRQQEQVSQQSADHGQADHEAEVDRCERRIAWPQLDVERLRRPVSCVDLDLDHLVPDLGQVEMIRGFLAEDMNLHMQDEETDLFPALARRCKSHELVDEILFQLTSEHELDKGLIDPILDALREIVEGRAAQNTSRLARSVRAFVETQHRHLNWENRVVLPMAETHLTDADKQAIGRSMAVRRGLTNPA